MRTRDVKSWVKTNGGSEHGTTDSPYASDDDMRPGAMGEAGPTAGSSSRSIGAGLPDSRHDWSAFIDSLGMRLRTPKTSVRLGLLKNSLPKLIQEKTLDEDQRVQLVHSLLATFDRYLDKECRNAAQDVVAQLVISDSVAPSPTGWAATKSSVQWLSEEAETTCQMTKEGVPRSAAARRANLAQWAFVTYAAHARLCSETKVKTDSSPYWRTLVQQLARIYNAVIVDAQRQPRIAQSAIIVARRAMRRAYITIPALLAALTAAQGYASMPLLGLVIDVSLRLRVGKEPVKGAADGQGHSYVHEAKDSILVAYTTHVVSSKTSVPQHIRAALHDFIATQLSYDDVDKSVRPVLEKMMLRSPEIAMPVAESLFEAYAHDTAPFLAALQAPISSASKSSSAATRQHCIDLFNTLVRRCTDKEALSKTAIDLANNLKNGKAASAEQRATNYEMLAAVGPDAAHSALLVASVASLLSKEAQEPAMRSAMRAIVTHLQWCLTNDVNIDAQAMQALAKEMNNAKAPLRKLVCLGVGESLWQNSVDNTSVHNFVKALLKAWETNLSNAATNTLTSPAGPLEGYIAAALLLGRAPSWHLAEAQTLIKANSILRSLSATQPKPSFLLNEKVVRRAASPEEQTWLLRALEGLILDASDAAVQKADVHVAIASALVNVAFTEGNARRQVPIVLQTIAASRPLVACSIVEHGLTQWLAEREVALATPASEDARAPKDQSRTVKDLLLAAAPPKDHRETERHEVLARLFIIAHHEALGAMRRQCFTELCQGAKVDPGVFVDTRLLTLYPAVRDALNVKQLHGAALASLSSLVTIRPEESAMLVMHDIQANLDPLHASALSNDDVGMFKIGPDALYIDVLAKKDEKKEDRNRKNFAIEQWEAELRESIARKRAAESKTLTKEQRKAVDAQRTLEAQVRERVSMLQTRIRHALAMIISMVEARARAAIDGNMSALVRLVLDLLATPQAQTLVGDELLLTLQSLASCCTERMGDYADAVRVTLLRTIDDSLVDEDYKAESYRDATLRILYRLHFLCEQAPLDLASISFLEPLLTRLVRRGGLGTTADEGDTIEEQLRLTLDIITYHGSACRDARFPRLAFVDDLVAIVASHAQLAKDAVASLRALGDAMKGNASPDEVQHMLIHVLAEEVYVRTGILQALQPIDLTELDFCIELWIACHDDDEKNARLASKAWEDNGMDVPIDYASLVLPYLEHPHAFVRGAASRGLATAAEMHPETRARLISALIAFYDERNKVLEPQYDRFGMVIEESLHRKDAWEARAAVAAALSALSGIFPAESLVPLFEFLIQKEGLGDRNETVRRGMLDASMAVIDANGKAKVSDLIGMLEHALEHPRDGGNDDVTEAIVILFGRLAKHLETGDKRIAQVVKRLVEALKTPSELVQVAVADCLAPLGASISTQVPDLIETLFAQLLHSLRYAERRGAAYGLAGLIKGRGIASIADFRVMSRLAIAIDDKKDTPARQGAMMAYETMIATLQRLFEPYIPQIVPHLLTCFGDQSTEVRDATQETSRVIMQNISGYGVRVIMPLLLQGLDEKQWRIKKGAIELLGAMAYCAPKQLSQFLPTIIPHLSEPIKDSHNQVRQAAERALKGFGDVISNPEVKQLVPVIMRALVDPNLKTPAAQKAILKQKWVHVLDGPSLALLIPVIDRGLRERGAQVQKDAARIVGNLASLTDSKDFVPYLESLVPLLRTVLISPVPDARATAAKSLGALVERLGEVHFVTLVPSLLDVLKSDLSSVDRQGSAQGLAEVLAGLGVERMEALLPDVINNASSSKRATVRESHVLLLIYLPATFGLRFAPYLGRIIPPILGGIADDTDSVREASMRAGRMIIANYSNRAVDLLLPELETGLLDENWRIRLSSIQLISDLLFRLSGITGTNEVENGEEEEGGAEQNIVAGNTIQKALSESLGVERRNQILGAFYLLRQDSVINVRQAAIQTWKAIVTNTPKLAREILPVLVDLITQLLAQGVESRETAGRALGELVSKLGERILGESIPMLQSKTDDEDASLRAGVCTAVTEILNNSTEHQLHDHQDALISIVKKGLVDASSDVREAAAEAFDALQEHIGAYAIDEIVPGLLETLVKEEEEESDTDKEEEEAAESDAKSEGEKSSDDDNKESDAESEEFVDDSEQKRALSALQEIMRGSADSVFPVLVPTLIAQPMSAFNASALVTLGSLAGNALYRRLSPILDAFATAIDTQEDDDLRESLEASLSTLMSCIFEYDGVYQLMTVLLSWSSSVDSAKMRARGCRYFTLFCKVKYEDADLGTYGIDWVRRLVSLFEDRNDQVVDAAVAGMEALIKTVPKEDLENITVALHHTLQDTGSAGHVLPGFLRPRGAAPLGAVFLAGLMNGTAEQREMGAYGIADIVERSSADSIKPMVVSMIGPLIRTCGDRHMPQVKTAILYALSTMLNFPQHCKPFYPQLQRSFQKAVADVSSNKVRTQACLGLGRLMAHQARVDAVIAELIVQIEPGNAGAASEISFEVNEISISGAKALARVLENAPADNVSAASCASILKLLEGVVANKGAHESFKTAIADVLGSYLILGNTQKDVAYLVDNHIARVHDGACDAAFASLCVLDMLTKAPETLYTILEHPRKIARLVGGWVSDGPAIARPARESRDILLSRAPWNQDDGVHDVL